MRNPFKKRSYGEKLKAQLGIQFGAIVSMERALRVIGIHEYEKLELVAFSQWLVLIGLAYSKVSENEAHVRECIQQLQVDEVRLISGLCNGVQDEMGEVLVPKGWLSGDPQHQLERFQQLYDRRKQQYNHAYRQANSSGFLLGQAVEQLEANLFGLRATSVHPNIDDKSRQLVRTLAAEVVALVVKTLNS